MADRPMRRASSQDPEERRRMFQQSRGVPSSRWTLSSAAVSTASVASMMSLVAQSRPQLMAGIAPSAAAGVGFMRRDFDDLALWARVLGVPVECVEEQPSIDTSLGIMTSLCVAEGAERPVSGFFVFVVSLSGGGTRNVVAKVKPWEEDTALRAAASWFDDAAPALASTWPPQLKVLCLRP